MHGEGLYLPCSFSLPPEQAAKDIGQCFSVRYNFTPQGNTNRDISYWEILCLLLSQLGEATGISWVEAKNNFKHTTMHRTVPHNKNYSALTSLMLPWQNLFQIMGKLKENEEVPKVCLTKQPTGKRQMWKTFHKKETPLENKIRTNWNLFSKQGTQIMVRHHFSLNWVAKIKILRTQSMGRLGL